MRTAIKTVVPRAVPEQFTDAAPSGWKLFYIRGTVRGTTELKQQYPDSARTIYGHMLLWPEIVLDEWCWKGYCGTNNRKEVLLWERFFTIWRLTLEHPAEE